LSKDTIIKGSHVIASGDLDTVGEITDPVGIADENGDQIDGYLLKGQNIENKLDELLLVLKKIEYHLMIASDTNLDNL